MPEVYLTTLSVAFGAVFGAGIVLATLRLMPNTERQMHHEEPASPTKLVPDISVTSSLFKAPLPISPKEGWEMAECEPSSPQQRQGSFQNLVALKNDELLSQIGSCSQKTLVVGVAGGTGSGKTTLAQAIRDSIDCEISFISHDNYYKDLTHLSEAERDDHNFDHPDSLDTDLLLEDLIKLKEGKDVEIPTYDFSTHMRTTKTETVMAQRIILVEGILIFTHEALREQMDIRVFVDTADDIRLIRRMSRDIEQRGRSPDSVIAQYMKTVRPMHIMFVEPSKQHAHVIVPVGLNQAVLDLIISRLRFQVAE